MQRTSSSRALGILLLNLGGPDSPGAIKPFLRSLLSDPDMVPMPGGALLRLPFAHAVSHFRSRKVRDRYELIGGRSPITDITTAQADGLQDELSRRGIACRTYVAMRHWHPSTADALDRLEADGIEHVVALPLYPQYSRATTGSSLSELGRVLRKRGSSWKVVEIESFYDHPAYLDALTASLEEALRTIPDGRREGTRVVFCAHSLPMKMIEAGDPYADQVRATIDGVLERVGSIKWHLGYQSRTGPLRWLGPSLEATIERLAASGVKDLVVVPLSFVSDHIETLWEIDIFCRQLAESVGIETFLRIDSFNDSPAFISALAEIVLDKITVR